MCHEENIQGAERKIQKEAAEERGRSQTGIQESDLRVEAVDSSFHLSRHGSFLELQLSGVHHRPDARTHSSF